MAAQPSTSKTSSALRAEAKPFVPSSGGSPTGMPMMPGMSPSFGAPTSFPIEGPRQAHHTAHHQHHHHHYHPQPHHQHPQSHHHHHPPPQNHVQQSYGTTNYHTAAAMNPSFQTRKSTQSVAPSRRLGVVVVLCPDKSAGSTLAMELVRSLPHVVKSGQWKLIAESTTSLSKLNSALDEAYATRDVCGVVLDGYFNVAHYELYYLLRLIRGSPKFDLSGVFFLERELQSFAADIIDTRSLMAVPVPFEIGLLCSHAHLRAIQITDPQQGTQTCLNTIREEFYKEHLLLPEKPKLVIGEPPHPLTMAMEDDIRTHLKVSQAVAAALRRGGRFAVPSSMYSTGGYAAIARFASLIAQSPVSYVPDGEVVLVARYESHYYLLMPNGVVTFEFDVNSVPVGWRGAAEDASHVGFVMEAILCRAPGAPEYTATQLLIIELLYCATLSVRRSTWLERHRTLGELFVKNGSAPRIALQQFGSLAELGDVMENRNTSLLVANAGPLTIPPPRHCVLIALSRPPIIVVRLWNSCNVKEGKDSHWTFDMLVVADPSLSDMAGASEDVATEVKLEGWLLKVDEGVVISQCINDGNVVEVRRDSGGWTFVQRLVWRVVPMAKQTVERLVSNNAVGVVGLKQVATPSITAYRELYQ